MEWNIGTTFAVIAAIAALFVVLGWFTDDIEDWE